MTPVEAWLFWICIFLYSAAAVAFLSGLLFSRQRPTDIGVPLALAGFVMNTAVVAVRWAAVGHPPLMGDYESALARSWVMVLLFLGLQLRFPALKPVGAGLLTFAVLMLGYGVFRSPVLQPLSPPFRSPWLILHISFAWLAYASFAVAAGLAVLFLMKLSKGNKTPFYERLPSPAVMDEIGYRFVAFGFVTATVMMAAGAIWANNLWGSYWSWDPIQTWAFITWLAYGIYLHLRVIHGWRMKKAAWLSIVCMITVIISFWVTNLVGAGLHVF